MATDSLALVLRWTARVWGALSVAFILMFVIGESIGDLERVLLPRLVTCRARSAACTHRSLRPLIP